MNLNMDNNKQMRIAILTASDFPYGKAPENFVREMGEGLDSNNIEVTIIRFWGDRYGNNNDTNIKCYNYFFKKPFKKSIFQFFELFFQLLNIPLFMLKCKFIFQSNILLLYGLDRAYTNIPILCLSKILGIKCYRIITEIYPIKHYANVFWRKPLILFNKIQLKYVDKFFDGIIVLSKYLFNLCLENNVPKHKLILIPHFIDFEFNDSHSNKREDNYFIICYSGTCSVENGIIDLLDAYEFIFNKYGLKNSLLLILGELTIEVEKIIKERQAKMNKNVILKGHLSKEEVEYELFNSNVLINPRRNDILASSGFPTKIGEYFKTKRPVVTTKTGDLVYYFHDKEEVVFSEPNNPQSLAEGIYYIYTNKEKAYEIGEKGFLWAINNLDSKKNAKKLIDFILQE